MKRLMLLFLTVSTFMVAQDAVGSYKLTGVDVLYTYVSRSEVTLTATNSDMGITQALATIPAAAPFNSQAMILTDGGLQAVGINLNVSLNADGSGSIAAGSYYPDVNTIQDENGNCVTLQQVLPVTDDFTYTSSGTMMADVSAATGSLVIHPGVNVLGIPGISQLGPTRDEAGNIIGYNQIGGLGLSGSLTFEDYPMVPTNPTLCAPADQGGDCFDFTIGDFDASGTLEVYPNVNLLGIPEYVPGGSPLTGFSGGFFLDDQCEDGLQPGDAGANCNSAELSSVVPGNTVDPDFYLEWHGVDGASSGLGYKDDEDNDEDGDGTWFDRDLGIPGVTGTLLHPDIAAVAGFPGLTAGIYGDVSDGPDGSGTFPAAVVDEVTTINRGYIMNAAFANWGGFFTRNAASYNGCLAQADEATCGALYGANDSGQDDDGTSGRLIFDFDIPCVPIIEAREVIAEFVEVGGAGCSTGDMDGNGGLNVVDVVALVNLVLTGECGVGSDCMSGNVGSSQVPVCAGDMNNDGSLNVLDVVAVVGDIMGTGRINGASSATFNVNENEVTMSANGYVGGVQMTLSHANGFELTLTDGGQFSAYSTKGTKTTVVIIDPSSKDLFSTNSAFAIESIIATADGSSTINTSIADLVDYTIGEAYPNPFNPTTQMSLTLNNSADVSVKVFNMSGQLIDVIASGQMSKGSYNLTWDGTNASSGVYFIQTQIGSDIHNQKIMLVK